MFIVELTYPGTWLDYEDDEWSWEMRKLVQMLENPLTEACLALALFEQQRAKPRDKPDREQWEEDSNRRREIEKELEAELNVDPFDPEARQELYSSVERELKREKWESGELPKQYSHRLIFMHAKSFLFAVDRIEKILGAIAEKDGVPDEVVEAKDAFEDIFPDLRGVRNTVAHIEDRGRGLDHRKEDLDLKPVQNRLVNAPGGGALILESLNGNEFGSTMSDGHYGEVEISLENIVKVCECIQNVIDALEWRGPQMHYPR
ncbi:hypothetical protein [Salinibacter ruber]|uniref:hypothetical protein n=1 Tax=Salinibacter ruber TaxID=146919 RepID=UPI0013C2CD4C|nr:hypothetical protein [Salinibacter ruber]